MANIVKFKINGLSSALSNVYTRVTDLSRNELYSGETLVSDTLGNVELDIGTAGSDGQGVIVYGDNYSTGNETSFKSFCGYGVVELLGEVAKMLTGDYISVICTGDSIADLGSSSNTVLISSNTKGWPANSFAQSEQLFNMLPDSGVSGNTTQMLLDRLQADVIDSGAQVAVIMIGTNDVHAQIAESVTIANMQTIVDNLTNAGIKVILTPITWRGDNHPTYTSKIETINAAYADIVNANPSAAISGSFDEFNGLVVDTARWTEVTVDRLHPNSSGGYLMGKIISKALDDNLVSTTPSSATQILLNPSLTGTGGTVGIGATGQAPTNFTVFYAQPSAGVGVSYDTDGVVLRAGYGETGGRSDAKIFQTINVSALVNQNADFIATAVVSVTKAMLREILSLSITIKPNTGKIVNYLFNGEDTNAVFQDDYVKLRMRALPTKLVGATSAEVYVTLLGRGNQDVEIKIHEISLTRIPQ